MRWACRVFFCIVFVAMIVLTVVASLHEDVLTATATLWPDPWFRATLADAYGAFLTIYVWVAWRERTWGGRFAWLILFLGLGSIAISAYMLWRLSRLGPGEGIERLLVRDAPGADR